MSYTTPVTKLNDKEEIVSMTTYNNNGSVNTIRNFVSEEVHEDGRPYRLYFETTYVNGRVVKETYYAKEPGTDTLFYRLGYETTYYPNGAVKDKVLWYGDRRVGTAEGWYSNGKRKYSIYCGSVENNNGGDITGPYLEFHPNGYLKHSHTQKNFKVDGYEEAWDYRGNKEYSKLWQGGILV